MSKTLMGICDCCKYGTETQPVLVHVCRANRGVEVYLCDEVCYRNLAGAAYLSMDTNSRTDMTTLSTICWGINRILDEIRNKS